MSNILTLTLKTGLLSSLRFLKISRGIRTLHVMTKGSTKKKRCNNYKYICTQQRLPTWLREWRTRLSVQETQEIRVWSLARKIPGGGHGNSLQYSCLDDPMGRGAWRATVSRVAKSWTLLTRLSMHTHAPTKGAAQYARQILTTIKGEIDSNTVTVGDFNTPLSSTDRPSRQKVSKETQLHDTLEELVLTGI